MPRLSIKRLNRRSYQLRHLYDGWAGPCIGDRINPGLFATTFGDYEHPTRDALLPGMDSSFDLVRGEFESTMSWLAAQCEQHCDRVGTDSPGCAIDAKDISTSDKFEKYVEVGRGEAETEAGMAAVSMRKVQFEA